MNMHKNNFSEMPAKAILELLGTDVLQVQDGNDIALSKVISLHEDAAGICFVNKLTDNNILAVSNKRSSFIIAPNSAIKNLIYKDASCWIAFVANPRLSYIKLLTKLFAKKAPSGMDPSARIHPNAKIGAGTYIGAFCTIGEVEIGENCYIDANVNIKDHVRIGNHVTISSSSTIGGDGFGFEFDPESEQYLTFPHLAGVVIGDHVFVGSSTVIDKGVLNDTIIEKNCRIDNLVHIAHNVVIEEGTVIVAHAMIAGSARIGKKCWISPGARILDGVCIANDVTIGMGAVVMKDVPAHSTYIGSPARSIREHKKMLDFINSSICTS